MPLNTHNKVYGQRTDNSPLPYCVIWSCVIQTGKGPHITEMCDRLRNVHVLIL